MKSLSRLFVSVCLMLATDLFAQISDSSNPTDDLLPSIESFFQRTARQHQEKLWLHLDKPYYGAGDKIWFKAYLVDATEHRTDTLSNFIYVDIVDRKGKTVLAKKIKRDSCGFANNFEIPHVFPAGGLYAPGIHRMDDELRPRILLPKKHPHRKLPIRTRKRRGNIHRSKNGTPRPSCDSPARTANPIRT